MAEQQAKHRHGLESDRLRGAQRSELVGQVFGFVIGMAAIGASVWLITSGHAVSGVVTILGAIAGLVTVFIKGKAAQTRELARKRRALDSDEPDQLELFPDDDESPDNSESPRS